MPGILSFIETTDSNETSVQINYYNTLPTPGAVTGDRPVTAITALNDGRAIAGIYYLTFTSLSPGVTGTCNVASSDTNNPYIATSVVVSTDDSQTSPGTGTRHDSLIGGVGVYFSQGSNFTTSWTATIIVGGYFVSGTPTQITSFGTLVAGATSAQKKLGIINAGDAICEQSTLGIYPGIYFKDTTGTPIHKVKVVSKTATAGKYVVSVSNYSGANNWADVYVARYSYNYSTNAYDTLASANALKVSQALCDDTTIYTAIITGVEMVLSDTIDGTSGGCVYIEAVSGAQIAPDVSGSPGAWTSSSDINLTEDGGGVSGRIQQDNIAYFWLRISTSTSDLPGNLRKFTLRPSAVSVGGLSE